ncbi:MAG: hypothetical protein ACR2RL_14495 [Gammaproteobacteria bacterium]
MNNLDHKLREYYEGQHLSERRAESMLAATERMRERDRRWIGRMAAALAVFTVGFGALHLYLNWRDHTQLVLQEVALNHRHDHPAEVTAHSYAEIANALDKLDFALEPPDALKANFVLEGGRYCSVQGRLATQLMLRSKSSGERYSLFATELSGKLRRVGARDATVGDVAVSLWPENGVFYALARTRAASP